MAFQTICTIFRKSLVSVHQPSYLSYHNPLLTSKANCFLFSKGCEEQGFEPLQEDLLEMSTQHGIGAPLGPYIPGEVRTLVDSWCRDHAVTISIRNAAVVYRHLRQHFKENIDQFN